MGQHQKHSKLQSSQQIVRRARELRQTATTAEEVLWQYLRGRRLEGYKFRRQHPIGNFITDFFCDAAMLIIEIDGAVHQEPTQRERDRQRTEILEQYGFALLRFSNEEVFDNIEQVVANIRSYTSNAIDLSTD